MRHKAGILSIVLVLALAISGVALAGHVSSHKVSGAWLCSLCVHAAGNQSAITPDPVVVRLTPAEQSSEYPVPTEIALPLSLHDHPSRAPPYSI
jgi:hypothetical protein